MGLEDAFSATFTLFRGDFEAGFFALGGVFNALFFATFLMLGDFRIRSPGFEIGGVFDSDGNIESVKAVEGL